MSNIKFNIYILLLASRQVNSPFCAPTLVTREAVLIIPNLTDFSISPLNLIIPVKNEELKQSPAPVVSTVLTALIC
jgi:hypothetical protein